MKGEGGRIGVAVMRFHLRNRGGVCGAKRLQQFLGLTLELIEIRVLAECASGKGLVHNELLSWLRFHVSRCARCPLARAEKSSSKQDISRSFQGDTVLPADTAAP